MQLKCPHCGVLLTGREQNVCRFCGEHLPDDLMNQVRSARAVYSEPGQSSPNLGDTSRLPRLDYVDTTNRSYVNRAPEPPQKKGLGKGPIIAIVVLVVALVLGVTAFALSGQIGSQQPAPAESSSTAAESSSSSSDGENAETPTEPTVTAKKSLAEYSWSELTQISKQISACKTQAEAYGVAKDFNLVNGKGKLTGEKLKVKLTTGETVQVTLVGIYHDQDASGNVAGMTFMTCAPVCTLAMNKSGSNTGGWEKSELRTYLEKTVLTALPTELSDLLIPVVKLSNNEGFSDSKSCVTKTTDTLWAPSFVEVAGQVTKDTGWYVADDVNNYNIYNAEGQQYQYFEDLGIAADNPADGQLVYSYDGSKVNWWMRTATPSTSDKYHVSGADGDQTVSDSASAKNGVVFGFCL